MSIRLRSGVKSAHLRVVTGFVFGRLRWAGARPQAAPSCVRLPSQGLCTISTMIPLWKFLRSPRYRLRCPRRLVFGGGMFLCSSARKARFR